MNRNRSAHYADLAERAAEMGRCALAKHYGRHLNAIDKACRVRGITPIPETRRCARYAALATLAETMTASEISRHYGVSRSSIIEACAARGIKPVVHVRVAKTALAPVQKRMRSTGNWTRKPLTAAPITFTAKSDAEAARDVLARFGPVYRCGKNGAADVRGKHWRMGAVVLSDAELIERAAARTFKHRVAG